MSTTGSKPIKPATATPTPKAGRKRSFQEAKARVLKQYAPALAKLAK